MSKCVLEVLAADFSPYVGSVYRQLILSVGDPAAAASSAAATGSAAARREHTGVGTGGPVSSTAGKAACLCYSGAV